MKTYAIFFNSTIIHATKGQAYVNFLREYADFAEIDVPANANFTDLLELLEHREIKAGVTELLMKGFFAGNQAEQAEALNRSSNEFRRFEVDEVYATHLMLANPEHVAVIMPLRAPVTEYFVELNKVAETC